jgi:hypothetical protein
MYLVAISEGIYERTAIAVSSICCSHLRRRNTSAICRSVEVQGVGMLEKNFVGVERDGPRQVRV